MLFRVSDKSFHICMHAPHLPYFRSQLSFPRMALRITGVCPLQYTSIDPVVPLKSQSSRKTVPLLNTAACSHACMHACMSEARQGTIITPITPACFIAGPWQGMHGRHTIVAGVTHFVGYDRKQTRSFVRSCVNVLSLFVFQASRGREKTNVLLHLQLTSFATWSTARERRLPGVPTRDETATLLRQ